MMATHRKATQVSTLRRDDATKFPLGITHHGNAPQLVHRQSGQPDGDSPLAKHINSALERSRVKDTDARLEIPARAELD